MPVDPSPAVVIVAVILFAVFLLLSFLLFMVFFSTWIQAYLANVHVMLLDLIGMKLRRTDINAVIRALVVAKQGGVDIPCREMERAWAQGANLERVTLAVIQASKRGVDVTFQDLVDADLEDRLAEALARGDEPRMEEAATR